MAVAVADVFQVAPLSLLTLIELVADLPVATRRPVPSNVGSNVILVPPPDASVNPGPGPAAAADDHDVPVGSVEMTTPLPVPLPTPVAIKLRPVNAISVPRTGNVALAFPADDQVGAAPVPKTVFADISVVATIWLVPSPTANHFRPVNAIPLPCPEKHEELDSRTVRHVPTLPLTSSE